MEFRSIPCRDPGKILFTVLIFILAPVFGLNAPARGSSESGEVELDVRFQNHVEIFSPQSPIVLEIRPRSLLPENPLPDWVGDGILNLHVSVFSLSEGAAGVRRRRQEPAPKSPVAELELQVSIPRHAEPPWIPVSLLSPEKDGVYEIVIVLSRKSERSGSMILNIPTNPLQRRQPKTLAEKTVQCVVFRSAPAARSTTDWGGMKKELLEIVDSEHPDWRRRLTQIPVLPKVGNLTAPLTSARLPEISRLTPFRERPSKNPEPEAERPVAAEETASQPASEPSGLLVELCEQWKSQPTGRIGSGHLKEHAAPQKTVSPPATPSGGEKTEPAMFALSAPETVGGETWEAFPLPVRETGAPHLLELDYLSGHPQEMGLGIVEMFEHDGRTTANVTVASGLHVAGEIVSDESPDAVSTHRLLFWPKTKNPMLLLVNRRAGNDAVFGKVRLYRISFENTATDTMEADSKAEDRIPHPFPDLPGRLVAGYLHRAEFLGRSPHSSDDWSNLFMGVERLTDSLHWGGYDGTILTVASKETTLYPTALFAPDPFSTEARTGSASVKDALGLLYRFFDRQRMTLISAVDFNMPLRKIGDRLRDNPALADEIFWDLTENPNDDFRYNLLHPIVQEAMIETVAEITDRYAGHASFGGIAVELSSEGYALLPILSQGVDDRTFREFQAEVAPEGSIVFSPDLTAPDLVAPEAAEDPRQRARRYTARARFIQGDTKVWEAWISWRTKKIRDFYARLAQTVARVKPEAKLYLAGGTMLDDDALREYCAPKLGHWMSLGYVVRMAGFDLSMLGEVPSLVFLRPSRVGVSPTDAGYEQFDSSALGVQFVRDGAVPGTLFFHEADGDRIAIPAGNRNRRRFVKQLAQSDVLSFFDGGNTLPLGEKDSLFDFIAAYRRLPAMPFQTFVPQKSDRDGDSEPTLQPVTVRFARQNDGLVMYLLNDAPFTVEAVLNFLPTQGTLAELGGRRAVAPLRHHGTGASWQVTLGPYDFTAVVLSDPAATIREVVVRRPGRFCGPQGELNRELDRLNRRIHAVQQGLVWDKLKNADFETVGESTVERLGTIVGWTHDGSRLFSAQIDSGTRFSGRNSLKLVARPEMENESGSITSDPFEAPSTGRLFVSIVFGLAEDERTLPVSVILSGRHRGQTWNRAFDIQPHLLPLITRTPPTAGIRWHRMIVPFDRLPTESFEDLRLGFRMDAPGTVWIDGVSLYQVSFLPDEIKHLQRLVLAARARCSQNRVSDLMTILEGHWAQYLLRHVPLESESPEAVLANMRTPASEIDPGDKPYAKNAAPKKEEPPKEEKRGIVDRIKGFFGR